MIYDMNPTYDDMLIIAFKPEVKNKYYTLSARRMNVIVDDQPVQMDDCLIAYSDTSKAEIVNHRHKLIKAGYYNPLQLYIRTIPNYYRKNK